MPHFGNFILSSSAWCAVRNAEFSSRLPSAKQSHRLLLQLRIFGVGVLQDRDVAISIIPEGEEILVGFSAVRDVAIQPCGPAEIQVCQWIKDAKTVKTSVINNLWELHRSRFAVTQSQISLTTYVYGIESGRTLILCNWLQYFDCLAIVLSL
jgi:hypothetical protein